MTDRRDDLLDETILRRALRLEGDERAPLFDAAAIAVAARQRTRLAVASAIVALGLVSVGAIAVWSAVVVFLPTVVASVFDLGLSTLALLAVPALAIVEVAQQPAVPLSLLAAIAIATAHEVRQRSLSLQSSQ